MPLMNGLAPSNPPGTRPMRLLFVKLKHIGDSLLLTPTLLAVRALYPGTFIQVVVRRGCEHILAGCPAIDELLTAAEPEPDKRSRLNWWRDGQLILKLRRERPDYAFELGDGDRGRFIAWLSGASVRCANDAQDSLSWWWRGRFNRLSHFDAKHRHRAEKDFYTVHDALPLRAEVPPAIFAREQTEPWEQGADLRDFAVIHPGTRWKRKQWCKQKWLAVGRHLLNRFSHLVVSAGPDRDEIALAGELCEALGGKALSTEGRLSWKQLAGLLHEARLFVGVDTAAMHLAAACHCPVVAIFGPSNSQHWRPWKVAHCVVTPAGPYWGEGEPASGQLDWKASDVEAAQVLAACDEVLRLKAPVTIPHEAGLAGS